MLADPTRRRTAKRTLRHGSPASNLLALRNSPCLSPAFLYGDTGIPHNTNLPHGTWTKFAYYKTLLNFRKNFMKIMKMNQTLADAKKKLASTLITEPNRRDYADEKVSLDFDVEQTLGQA